MDLPEIPVLEEHTSPPGIQATAAQRLQHVEQHMILDAAVGAMTGGQSPPATAAPADAEARRWSFDGASSVHSDFGWELLSHGQPSHCGSSPRSVSPSEAYDSEGADEVEGASVAAARLAARACQAALLRAAAAEAAAAAPVPARQTQVEAGEEKDLLPFGSLVLPAGGHLAAAAEAEEEACAAAGVGSVVSSPRSSFEHASSRASHHDLYSLSQDGSADAFSDHDSYIEDMMAQGEPDLDHSAHRGKHSDHDDADLADAAGKPAHPALHLLAAAPAATLAAAARGAYCAASTQLRALAASFGAYLARIVPASAEVAQRVARGVAEIVGSLQARVPPLPQGLGSLADSTAALSQRAQLAAQRARKNFGLSDRVNWAKVALALGGACGVLGLLLCRSLAEQARVAEKLMRREAEFSSLLTRIAELQRNISSYHSHSRVPIIRHVSTATVAAASSAAGGGATCWPAMVVV